MSDAERLHDIREAIALIEEVAQQGRDAFLQSRILQTSTLYNFVVIGEAVSGLTDATKQAHPTVDWRQMSRYRNFVAHAYMHVDPNRLWITIQRSVPRWKQQIEAVQGPAD